jgi:hypothetical protein
MHRFLLFLIISRMLLVALPVIVGLGGILVIFGTGCPEMLQKGVFWIAFVAVAFVVIASSANGTGRDSQDRR